MSALAHVTAPQPVWRPPPPQRCGTLTVLLHSRTWRRAKAPLRLRAVGGQERCKRARRDSARSDAKRAHLPPAARSDANALAPHSAVPRARVVVPRPATKVHFAGVPPRRRVLARRRAHTRMTPRSCQYSSIRSSSPSARGTAASGEPESAPRHARSRRAASVSGAPGATERRGAFERRGRTRDSHWPSESPPRCEASAMQTQAPRFRFRARPLLQGNTPTCAARASLTHAP